MSSVRIKRVAAATIGLASAVCVALGFCESSALATTTPAEIVGANSTKPAATLRTDRSQEQRPVLTKQAVTDCIQQLATAKNRHALTPAEAQTCAPGAPVFPKNDLPYTDPGAIFIVISSNDRATINFHTSTSASHLSTSAFQSTSASCSNDWKNDSAGFTDVLAWGSISGYGYGNHCGYSDFPNSPSVQVSNAAGGWDDTRGHYDSNYGKSHFGQNYAADWSNVNIHVGPTTDTFQCRIWINPDATIWHACY
jgi:hypothetical protein